LGSLSPDGSAVGLGVGMKNVYAGGRVERGRDRGRRISESLSPRLSPDDVGADDTVAGTGMGQRRTIPDGGRCASSSSSTVSSSPTVMPTARTEPMEAPAIPSQRDISTPIENGEVGKRSRFSTSDMSILDVNPSHTPKLASPTTSYPASVLELPSHSPSNPTTKGRLSVDNPEHEGGTIVGRAVGIVSSAGAYLGFWQSAQGGASS
jgi:hypothetical protein